MSIMKLRTLTKRTITSYSLKILKFLDILLKKYSHFSLLSMHLSLQLSGWYFLARRACRPRMFLAESLRMFQDFESFSFRYIYHRMKFSSWCDIMLIFIICFITIGPQCWRYFGGFIHIFIFIFSRFELSSLSLFFSLDYVAKIALARCMRYLLSHIFSTIESQHVHFQSFNKRIQDSTKWVSPASLFIYCSSEQLGWSFRCVQTHYSTQK